MTSGGSSPMQVGGLQPMACVAVTRCQDAAQDQQNGVSGGRSGDSLNKHTLDKISVRLLHPMYNSRMVGLHDQDRSVHLQLAATG